MSANGVSTIVALSLYWINAGCGHYCDIRGFDYFYRLRCFWTHICSIVVKISRYCQGSCRGNITCSSAYESCQLLVDRCLRSSTTWITQHTRLKIVDALLTLIFKMGHGACHFLLCLSMQPSLWVYITTTKSLFKYQAYKIKSYWRSIDAYFATGIFAICNHFVWRCVLLIMFLQPFYHLHVFSPLSLHCS